MSSSEKSLKTTEVTLLELTDQSVYKNRLVVKHFGNLTLAKALASKGASIGAIAKESEDKAIRCITNLFKSVALYFDTKLSQEKAEVIATEILYKYAYRSLKLEDLVVICFRLKEGEIYKLSPARILREIKAYSKEREALAIKNSINAGAGVNMNEDIAKRLKKHFRSIPDPERLASKRFGIDNQFKK
jgi:hypothetical protein